MHQAATRPEKANHNRPPALIFTGDVLKDILNNPSYLGKVNIDGRLADEPDLDTLQLFTDPNPPLWTVWRQDAW